MSDRRLADETTDPWERALLDEARSGGASPRARANTLAALGLAVGGGGGTAARSLRGAKLALGGVGVGAVVVVGALLLRGAPDAPAPPASATPTEAVPARAATIPSAVGSATSVSPSSSPGASAPPAVSEARPVLAAPSARPSVKPAASATDSLSEEVRLIDEARKALYAGDKEGSLRALDEYDRRFPATKPGRLAPEARRLRERAGARP